MLLCSNGIPRFLRGTLLNQSILNAYIKKKFPLNCPNTTFKVGVTFAIIDVLEAMHASKDFSSPEDSVLIYCFMSSKVRYLHVVKANQVPLNRSRSAFKTICARITPMGFAAACFCRTSAHIL